MPNLFSRYRAWRAERNERKADWFYYSALERWKRNQSLNYNIVPPWIYNPQLLEDARLDILEWTREKFHLPTWTPKA